MDDKVSNCHLYMDNICAQSLGSNQSAISAPDQNILQSALVAS